MRTDRRIEIYLILIAPAVILFAFGVSDLGDAGSRVLGVVLAIAGLVIAGVALAGLRRTARGPKHLPAPSSIHRGKKQHHKGVR